MTEDIESAKDAALSKASKCIAGLLTTPDQLDKVEQLRRKILRNKAAADSRLKTAVQSQVDGIRAGLKELKSSQDDIAHVKKLLSEVSEIFNECEPLNDQLLKVKLAHERHTKLTKTNQHLKLIFNVPETIKTTQELINAGKLLQAHKNIMELESTRDDLLMEVYKIYKEEGNNNHYTQSPLCAYFSEIENLSKALKKQISLIIGRTLGAARHTPTELVTSLRIVQREERSDARCITQQKETGFMPPGRPKFWKEHCYAIIKKSIDDRFDSNQLELTDKTEKMWLVRHLERMRSLILEDLISIKHLVRPCFPPEYRIFQLYIHHYHEAMSRMSFLPLLEDFINHFCMAACFSSPCENKIATFETFSSFKLEDFARNQNPSRPNECVTLLQWTAEYYGPDLLGHPELKDYVDALKPKEEHIINVTKESYMLEDLLSKGVIDSLTELYVKTTAHNINTCLEKMCTSESQDWHQDKLPEADAQDFYQSSLPIILFQLLDQNLQVGAFIKKNVKLKVLDVCVKSLTDCAVQYKQAAVNFKVKYFENRFSVKYYEPYMISIANNSLIIAEFAEQMKSQHRAELGEETFSELRVVMFNAMIEDYHQLSHDVCDILLDGVCLDLESYFQDLLTRKWLTSSVINDTIVATLDDYVNDYIHLKPLVFQYTMDQAEKRIVLEYVRALLSRRITFRNFEERKDGAAQIQKEANKISETFTRLRKRSEESQEESSSCNVLHSIAEVLRLRSTDIVSLEISGLAGKYKDFRADHALALLAVRGDMGRTECLQMITDLQIRENDELPESSTDENFFSRVTPAVSVLESLESRFKKN